MLKVFDFCARTLMIALTVFLIFRLWSFFAPRPIDRYIHGGLIGAEQTETLYTGFATLPLLHFTKGRQLFRFDPFSENGGIPDKPDGFCYRLYDLAIGYQNLREALRQSTESLEQNDVTLPEPQVLAANAVEARQGGAVHRYDCDSIEFTPTKEMREARLDFFRVALEGNKQWRPHRENAHAVLVSFDQDLQRARGAVEKAARRKQARNGHSEVLDAPPMRAADFSFGMSARAQNEQAAPTAGSGLTSNGGALGSLKLTFSTIALFTRDKNWFFQKNEFYVRQDNAEVTYGVDFYHEFHAKPALFGARHVNVTLPEPRVLATDRYSLALAAHPSKFNPARARTRANASDQEEAPQDPIEKAIRDELKRQIERVDDHAVATSKGLIADQIRGLMRAQGANVVVRFQGEGATPAFDLLQRLNAETKESE